MGIEDDVELGDSIGVGAASPPPCVPWTRGATAAHMEAVVEAALEELGSDPSCGGSWRSFSRLPPNSSPSATLLCISSPLPFSLPGRHPRSCLNALRIIAHHGFSHFAIETDCSELLGALSSTDFDCSPGGVLFRHIRALLHLEFPNAKLSFAGRSCNSCAHDIARRWRRAPARAATDPGPTRRDPTFPGRI
uniref:RNase H type-1 domain-containing protein n=1 Tax=Oryza meridionalis TaxID=40149 RepID=A0A0E0DZK0_9ORYZ